VPARETRRLRNVGRREFSDVATREEREDSSRRWTSRGDTGPQVTQRATGSCPICFRRGENGAPCAAEGPISRVAAIHRGWINYPTGSAETPFCASCCCSARSSVAMPEVSHGSEELFIILHSLLLLLGGPGLLFSAERIPSRYRTVETLMRSPKTRTRGSICDESEISRENVEVIKIQIRIRNAGSTIRSGIPCSVRPPLRATLKRDGDR